MPFRFRKIISIGKNFHINLSKGGVSESIGAKGFHVNLGKRGLRSTISAPGTGMSYTSVTGNSAHHPAKSSSTNKTIANLLTISLIVIVICALSVCGLGAIFLSSNKGSTSTSTPTSDIAIIIQQTANAASIQTFEAQPTFTMLPSVTFAPTWTLIPTGTPFTVAPPPTIYSANTLVAIPPFCTCKSDNLNCASFKSQVQAQVCFNYCKLLGVGDVYKLDRNHDGIACEGK